MVSKRNKVTDLDNPEWTEEDFARAKDPKDVLSAEVLAQFGRKRGPQLAPKKVPVSIRLSPKVLDHFRAKGFGWQSKIDEALGKIADKEQAAPRRQATSRRKVAARK
jgi:uncharacterized protein (DUF4415 family)